MNENLTEFTIKNDELKKSIDKLKDYDQKLESHTELLKSKNETRKSILKNHKSITDFISRINGDTEKSLKRLKRIEEIGKDSNCPECERPLEDHYDKLTTKYKIEIDLNKKEIELKQNELTNIEKELESIENSIELIKKEIHQFETEIKRGEELKKNSNELYKKVTDLNKEITETESDLRSLAEVKFDESKLTEFENLRDELKPYFEKYNDYKSKTENLPKKKSDLIELKRKLKDFDESLLKLKTDLSNINFDEESYEQLKQKREESENTFNELKENLHQIKSELMILQNKIEEICKELEKEEKERTKINDLKKKSNLMERLKSFVSEFKSRITSQELPAISNEASRLFASITKGRYQNLRIDSTFNFLVNREDKEVELLTLSGGEKDLASLCLRVAISKRISALAGRTNMGFLALDEVFGSQDEDRREELLNALGKISNEFKQIFVVSHNQDVQEAFPQRLLIQKVNGFSTVNFFSS
jgi:exonuclease SbcC